MNMISKIFNTNKKYIKWDINPLVLLYLLGVMHWLFFFFFVDYYTYSNISPTVEIKEILNKGSSISQTNNEIYDTYKWDKQDKQLLKDFFANKDINKLFQYRYFTAHDWVKEQKYQDFVGKMIRSLTIPYHVPNYPKLGKVTERFLGSTLFTISPQVVLLYFFNSQVFTVINLLLMYSLGFCGCILLKKRYKLELLSFTFLFLIFNFNGYWVSKVAAYGPGYLGYFLMPFVIYAILRIPELDHSNIKKQQRWGILLGFFTTAILIQGTLHLYVEIITFIIIWGIVNFRYWPAILTSLVVSFSLGMIRLLPSAISYGVAPNPHALIFRGYSHPQHFIDAFVDLRTHLDAPIYGWWESSLYVSLIGLFFLVYFGMWGPFLKLEWSKFNGWKSLALPCFIILIISFRRFKFFLIPNWIPLLNAESVTTRYMIIPLVIITIIAAINFQGFIDRYWKWKRVRYLLLLSIITLALFLLNHSRLWRMHKVQNEFFSYNAWNEGERISYEELVDVQLYINNNMNDTVYIIAFWIGLTVSVLSFFLAVWWLLRKPSILSKRITLES